MKLWHCNFLKFLAMAPLIAAWRYSHQSKCHRQKQSSCSATTFASKDYSCITSTISFPLLSFAISSGRNTYCLYSTSNTAIYNIKSLKIAIVICGV